MAFEKAKGSEESVPGPHYTPTEPESIFELDAQGIASPALD